MLISELKPLEEILGFLNGERAVFLLGCKGCAEACHTGGEQQVLETKAKLEEAGKAVSGWTTIDFLCDKALVKLRLRPYESQVVAADSVLVMSCGIGIQAVANSVATVVHPACNTLSLGGRPGEWRGAERCRECGDCVLDLTGGICPMTACTKGLLNGGCGGTKDGRCEVEPTARECGWQLIYERLKALGRLDRMRAIAPPKNYAKMRTPITLRSSSWWALEQEGGH